jgi:integrase
VKLNKRLTDALARTVKLKPGEIAWDGELAGFGVRQQRTRSWHVQYDAPGGRTRKMSLGPIAGLPATKARTLAVEMLAKVRIGQDPIAAKRLARDEAEDTFGGHLRRYLAFKRKTIRTRSYEEVERHLVKHCAALHPRLIREIDRKAAASTLARVADKSGDRAADSVRASANAYLSWLLAEGLAETNAFAGTVKRGNGKGREHVPTLAELVEIWKATQGGDAYGDLVRLLMLTGARRTEIGGLTWDEVDLDAAALRLPAERMKHGHAHQILLPRAAVEILRARTPQGSFVFGRAGAAPFTGWSKALANLRKRLTSGRRNVTLHDFRRAISTTMNDVLDVPPHITAELLAHRTFRAGVEHVYSKAQYVEQRRAGIERWGEYLLAAVEERDTVKVTPMARPLSRRRK